MYKLIFIIIFSCYIIYNLIVDIINLKSLKNPISDKLNDIYDSETYLKWKNYKLENAIVSIIFGNIELVLVLLLFIFNIHSKIENIFSNNIYVTSLTVIGFYILIDFILSTISSYIYTMVIEEKYGFNKTKLKTFIKDKIRGFLISSILICGILMLFIKLYDAIGNYIILAFIGILILLLLLVLILYPFLSKMSNKFEELEECELKTKLTELLNKHGYTIRKIEVMKASERTTKSNAYFTGTGKTKTIVLYDNLIETMTPDELCAIFAHEMGHGLNKDTIKNNIMSFFLISLIVFSMWGLVNINQIYLDFGFNSINYGFAFIVLSYIVMPFINTLISLLTNYISRKAEYRADYQAVKEGYGPDLVTALKKLSKANFAELNPSKVIVALSYSHPPLLQRIEAIEKEL